MYHIFYAGNFDQNIGNWNIVNVTNLEQMFHLTGLSTDNYDALLMGWASQAVKVNRVFDAGYSKYSSAAEGARAVLIGTYGWTIN